MIQKEDVCMYNEKMYSLGATGSAIRELYEYGKKRKQEIGEDKVFDFSLGNPNVPTPQIVNETLINLIKNTDPTKLHAYTSAPGDIFVRKSIADYLNKKYECNASESLIYMTVGAAASLTISLKALLNEGEEVIVFAPFFPEYKVFVENALGKIKVVGCKKPSFLPDYEEFEKSITKNTKCVIINSPNNPSGVVYSEEDIKRISEILKKKQKEFNNIIYLISDEPYRELVYDGEKIPFITNYYENTIVCYSFSKSLSLPGERIGYILVSSNCNDSANVFKAICGAGRSLGFVCAPALFQYMVPYCLGMTSDLSVYEENRKILYDNLKRIGYDVVNSKGAFYLLVEALGGDAVKFSNIAKNYELLLVPSDSFGVEGYVRISYCVSKETVVNSLSAFEKMFNDMDGEKYE